MKAAVVFLLAQIPSVDPSWAPLANFGIAGVVIGWFMWRDGRDGAKREAQHAENMKALKLLENAFRINTNSNIVVVLAMKHLDSAYTELLARIKDDNEHENTNH